MIPVICCSSFEYCQPLGAGAFRRAFTTSMAPQCRAFSRAFEIEKLKAPLLRGPEGTVVQMTGALPKQCGRHFEFDTPFHCVLSKSNPLYCSQLKRLLSFAK